MPLCTYWSLTKYQSKANLTWGSIFYLFSLNFVTLSYFITMTVLITESVFVYGFSGFYSSRFFYCSLQFFNVALGCCSLMRRCKYCECRTLTEVKLDGLLTWNFRLLLQLFGLIWLFQLSTLKIEMLSRRRSCLTLPSAPFLWLSQPFLSLQVGFSPRCPVNRWAFFLLPLTCLLLAGLSHCLQCSWNKLPAPSCSDLWAFHPGGDRRHGDWHSWVLPSRTIIPLQNQRKSI